MRIVRTRTAAVAGQQDSRVPHSNANILLGSEPDKRGRWRLLVIWLLLVAGVLEWRNGELYAGGLDGVVVAKGVVTLAALLLAAYDANLRPRPSLRGARTLALVGTYLAVTVIGGMAGGSVTTAAILAGRVAMLAAAVTLIFSAYGTRDAIRGLLIAMWIIGSICAVTGIKSLANGRLAGGLLPLSPNVLAMLFGAPAVGLAWRYLHLKRRRFDLVGVGILILLVFATGSRTTFLATVIVIILIGVQARRIPKVVVIAAFLLVPVVLYLFAFTPFLSGFFERGGGASVGTLNSRTIAWSAAFDSNVGFWQQWFGGGLQIKTVGVTGTYWSTQVLDSSWVSGYVQAGLVGLIVLCLWSVSTLITALRCERSSRALLVGLAVYALIYSVMASGLIDSYALFLLMFSTSMCADNRGIPAWHPSLASQRGTPSADAPTARDQHLKPTYGTPDRIVAEKSRTAP